MSDHGLGHIHASGAMTVDKAESEPHSNTAFADRGINSRYYDNSDRISYAESSLAPSTIRPEEDDAATSIAATDDASLHSRSRFLPQSSSSYYTSAAAARRTKSTSGPVLSDGETFEMQEQQRRATVAYLADLRAARAPRPKPKKTKSRKAFEMFGDVVNFVMPVDIDEGKTSMKESSLGHLLKKGDVRTRADSSRTPS